MSTKIVVKQVGSLIGMAEKVRQTVRGLGLKRIGHSVELPDTPATRGMITKVQHILEVTVMDGAPKLTGARHRNKKK